MKITVKNCNNIDEGSITLIGSKLNIKFGINGIGKSTIAKAIQFSIGNSSNLNDLLPFKLQENNPENLKSEINIDGEYEIKNVLVFNENYLNQFVYKPDELISNSFEIFIKTPEYTESINNIESILEDIKDVFSRHEELEKVISYFSELSKSFKTTKTGLSKTSAIYKGLQNGNQIEYIPDHLKGYSSFLKNENCTKWLDWQIKGGKFLDISDDCPYCTSEIKETKETIKSVSETYDKKVIGDFTKIIDAIENLGDYFSNETKTTLRNITNRHSGLDESEIDYIVSTKRQIDNFLTGLNGLKEISSRSFKEDKEAEKIIRNLKINIELYDRLKSNETKNIVDSLNTALGGVLNKIGKLQGEINQQKSKTQRIIRKHENDINIFFRNAGYQYTILISDEDGEYKIKLQHIDFDKNISGGSQHLSFGEKNAFALVLFMYQVLSENPDLIILDDPISSFDKNKKYAIMNMLFRNDNCLKNKTVLMLTHDIEPVIDVIKILKEFNNLSNASFLYLQNGKLGEKIIEKNNLLTFSQICKKVIQLDNVDSLIKSIYLRRYYEILDKKCNEYQVLSNLLHKRPKDDAKYLRETGEKIRMESDKFEKGVKEIKKMFDDFDYDSILAKISDENKIKEIYNSSNNGYEKLQLIRILNGTQLNSVLQKFINESYHIENEFIIQLNPMDFDLVPAFIIEQCDQIIAPNENSPD